MTSSKYAGVLGWDDDDQVFVAYVPALAFLSTFGDTREEALLRTREAIGGYVEAAEKTDGVIRAPSDSEILDIAV